MSEAAQCPVCQTDMGLKAYGPKSDEDREELADDGTVCFRMTCGHAFHIGCAVRALRVKAECPVCRGGRAQGAHQTAAVASATGQAGPTAADITDVQLTLTFENGQFVLRDEAHGSSSGPEAEVSAGMPSGLLARIDEALLALKAARSSGPIQKLRNKYNGMVRQYREHVRHLNAQRASLMRAALTTMRRDHREDYELERRRLRKSLKRLMEREAQVIVDTYGPEKGPQIVKTITEHMADTEYAWPDSEYAFGPHKHRFWAH
jgi:hypothetical protein